MKITLSLMISLISAASVSANPVLAARDVDTSLVPEFGVTAGIPSNDGTGSCVGANGKNIPCFCPPPRDEFIAKLNEFVNAGNAFGTPVSFPSDNEDLRLAACVITLQNFSGQGIGCPAVSAPNFMRHD